MTTAALIAKLEAELYDTTDPRYSALDLAKRVGWNQRAHALIADLRIELGLEELAAAPIDLRVKHELMSFDVSDELELGGEGG